MGTKIKIPLPNAVVWPKSATLPKGYCSRAGWNKEQEKGKASPWVSSRDRRGRSLQADNTCQWQNTPTPECFTAISGRTWFGLEALPACIFSKQKHWSAYAQAEKRIKLKYCCFAENLCQQYKLCLGVRGCPGLPSRSTCQAGLAQIWFSNSCHEFPAKCRGIYSYLWKYHGLAEARPLVCCPSGWNPHHFGAQSVAFPWFAESRRQPIAHWLLLCPLPSQPGWAHLCRKRLEGSPGSTVWCHRTVKAPSGKCLWFGRCSPWFSAWQWVVGSQEGAMFSLIMVSHQPSAKGPHY